MPRLWRGVDPGLRVPPELCGATKKVPAPVEGVAFSRSNPGATSPSSTRTIDGSRGLIRLGRIDPASSRADRHSGFTTVEMSDSWGSVLRRGADDGDQALRAE